MEPNPNVAPKKGTKKANILLVDDQQAKLLSYEVILAGIGETLIKASSACEAFECLLKNEIALILIDVCMPDLDGFKLAALIREHPRFQRIGIIFVSAVSTTHLDQLRGYDLGALDYIPVPVAPELLRAKVRVFIDLYRKTRELERCNAVLEQRVLERTAALSRLNEELEARIEERTREREKALARLFEAQKADSIGELTGRLLTTSTTCSWRWWVASRCCKNTCPTIRSAIVYCTMPFWAAGEAPRSPSDCWPFRAVKNSSRRAWISAPSWVA